MFLESLVLLAAASGATPSQPAQQAGATKPVASMYDAVVATEETPAVKDLTKPAVFIKDGAKSAIIGQAGAGLIA